MTCETITSDGFTAIVCTRGRRTPRCRWCPSAPGRFLCDWKLGKRTTCDKPICDAHAFQVEPDKHLCPAHVLAYTLWLRDVVGVAY